MPVGIYPGAASSIGNGVTIVFAYPFRILAEADLSVTVDGVAQALNVDYTIDGVGAANGGNVTFATAPAEDTLVVRERVRPYKRTEEDYQRNGAFDEETVDKDFDSLQMQAQQLEAIAKRAIKAPVSETDDQVFTQDDWDERAGKFVAFDALGAPIMSTGGLTGVAVETVVQMVRTITALKALAAPSTVLAYIVLGFEAAGDGGGGFYWWDASDSTADDGGSIIELDAGGVGRFKKLF